jgi:hypothetical protein
MHESPNYDGKPRVCQLYRRMHMLRLKHVPGQWKQELNEFLKSTERVF